MLRRRLAVCAACLKDGILNRGVEVVFLPKQTFKKSAGKRRQNNVSLSEVPGDGCHGERYALECRVTNRRLHTTFTGAATTN